MKKDRFPMSPGVVITMPVILTFVLSASVGMSSMVIDCVVVVRDFFVELFFFVFVFVVAEDVLSVMLVGDFVVG